MKLPEFLPLSEGLMSNLASRPHEWNEWAISELNILIKKKLHTRILLEVNWKSSGSATYLLLQNSSPSLKIYERNVTFAKRKKQIEKYIKTYRKKNSKGAFISTP